MPAPSRLAPLCAILTAAALAASLAARDAGAKATPAIDFARHVRPVLSDRCFACHGPDGKQRKADLRLDTKEGLMSVVKPGDPAASEFIERICSDDRFKVMPPPKVGAGLTPEQIDLFKRWVAAGAPWAEHWAFAPPKNVSVPAGVHPVDHFVRQRLTAEGLSMNAEATPAALCRRLYLDLTGLPPTPEELDRYLGDKRPNAYERLVEELFRSPRHGEQMARPWLDAVRYSDTHGLHFDAYREVWPYRDWVVQAFADNVPFDRFLIEQIAGDLLPNRTREQVVASGFNRMHVTTNEGGSINEEVYVRNVTDRVDGIGTVVLGLTTGCAKCHDHKFDPLTQREYYGLFAFFNNLDDNPLDGNSARHSPIQMLGSPEELAKLDALKKRASELRAKIAAEVKNATIDEAAELTSRREIVWVDDAIPAGAKASGGAEAWAFGTAPDHPVLSGSKSHFQTADGRGQHYFTGAKPPLRVGAGDVLFASMYIDPDRRPDEIMLQFHVGDWKHRAYWGEDKIPFGKANTTERVRIGDMPAEVGAWVRLEVPVEKLGLAPGTLIDGWAFTQFGGTLHWDKAGLVTQTPQGPLGFSGWAKDQAVKPDAKLPKDVTAALKVAADKRNAAQKKLLRDYYIENVSPEHRAIFEPLQKDITAVEAARDALDRAIPATLVSQERKEQRPAYLLKRGEYDQRGPQVERITPSFLPPLPADAPRDRLGFARWCVDANHPLTARVAVNRFWQQLFGTGLVKTSEDFGLQSDPPSHPELLDCLAVRFVQSGWDVRGLLRLMVTSQAYRQSAQVTAEKLQRDPTNRLLARGPRFRLDAETVRDQALYVSGLLQEHAGGPAVKPPQPYGLWEAVGYPRSNTANFVADKGAERVHRRSLYTFWKRTSPPPQMTILDAPSRESCVVRRERTNTPLQALLLMNETQFVEASRALAERMLKESHSDDMARGAALFRRATGRWPTERESGVLMKALGQHRATYRGDVSAAKALLAVGETNPDATLDASEVAAWAMVANLVLNLDEVVTR